MGGIGLDLELGSAVRQVHGLLTDPQRRTCAGGQLFRGDAGTHTPRAGPRAAAGRDLLRDKALGARGVASHVRQVLAPIQAAAPRAGHMPLQACVQRYKQGVGNGSLDAR